MSWTDQNMTKMPDYDLKPIYLSSLKDLKLDSKFASTCKKVQKRQWIDSWIEKSQLVTKCVSQINLISKFPTHSVMFFTQFIK